MKIGVSVRRIILRISNSTHFEAGQVVLDFSSWASERNGTPPYHFRQISNPKNDISTTNDLLQNSHPASVSLLLPCFYRAEVVSLALLREGTQESCICMGCLFGPM